jgi:hypothetical protein
MCPLIQMRTAIEAISRISRRRADIIHKMQLYTMRRFLPGAISLAQRFDNVEPRTETSADKANIFAMFAGNW